MPLPLCMRNSGEHGPEGMCPSAWMLDGGWTVSSRELKWRNLATAGRRPSSSGVRRRSSLLASFLTALDVDGGAEESPERHLKTKENSISTRAVNEVIAIVIMCRRRPIYICI